MKASEVINEMIMAAASQQYLDNLGIRLDMSTLPSAAVFKLTSRAKLGCGFPGKLWARRIRPWLMPERQALIDAAHDRAIEIRRQEFLVAVMERGERGVRGDKGEEAGMSE